MNSRHVGILTIVCALVLFGVWRSELLTGPKSEGAVNRQGVDPLTQLASRGEPLAAGPASGALSAERSEAVIVSPDTSDDEAAPLEPLTRLLGRLVSERGDVILAARIDVPDWEDFGEATSDELGQFALVTDRENIQIWNGRTVSRQFRIAADGYATRFVRAAVERDVDTDLGDVVLAPGGVLIGRVVDEEGTPMVGARVIMGDAALGAAVDEARRLGPRTDEDRVELVSGADGAYRLAGVPATSGRVWAHVSGRLWGFSPTLEVVRGVDTRVPDVVLERPDAARVIAGLVLEPGGAPVANAVVVASGLGQGTTRYARAVANEAGRFELIAFDGGPHRIGGFHPEAAFTPAFLPRVSPGADDVELRLTELRWVEIRLVDDRDGTLLEKPWTHIDAGTGLDYASQVPRAEREVLGPGRVRAPLPDRKFTIGASAPGYAHRSVGPFMPSTVGAEIEIRLQPKPMLRGVVVADGKPVEGARVQAMRDLSGTFSILTEGFQTRLFGGGAFATETDENGVFEHPVSFSAPSGAHVVHASKSGWATAELVVEIGEDGADDLVLELNEGGAIEGKVLLPAGTDPRGAVVAASNGDGEVITTRATEGGNYRLEHLRAGPWELQYREEDQRFVSAMSASPPEDAYEGDCVVAEGDTTHHDLDMRGLGSLLEGRLLIDATPAAGWTARWQKTEAVFAEDSGDSVILGPGGDFALPTEGDSGRLVLETPESAASFIRITRAITPSQAETEARLDLITGELTGTAKPGAKLRLVATLPQSWGYSADIVADASGRFTARAPAGPVTIQSETVEPGKFTRYVEAMTVEVPAAGTVSVDLD